MVVWRLACLATRERLLLVPIGLLVAQPLGAIDDTVERVPAQLQLLRSAALPHEPHEARDEHPGTASLHKLMQRREGGGQANAAAKEHHDVVPRAVDLIRSMLHLEAPRECRAEWAAD